MDRDYRITVLVDSREKKWEHIQGYFEKVGVSYRRTGLRYGDYSLLLDYKEDGYIKQVDFSAIFAIERKANLDEIIQNLARKEHRRRFDEELERARIFKGRMDILIEEEDWYMKVCTGDYKSKTPIKVVRGHIAEVQSHDNVFIGGMKKDYMGQYILDRLIYEAKKYLDGKLLYS